MGEAQRRGSPEQLGYLSQHDRAAHQSRLATALERYRDEIVAAWLQHGGLDETRWPDVDRYLKSLISGLCEVLRNDDWLLTQTIIDGLAERRARTGLRLEYGLQRALLAGRHAVKPFYPEDIAAICDELMLEVLLECGFRFSESYQGIHLNSETERVHTRIIKSLVAALEARDPYTKGHSVTVALLAQRVAEVLGDSVDPGHAYLAGLLHDVGKLAIPDNILLKPGSLTKQEWATMRTHSMTGANILKPIRLFTDIVAGVLSHHENYDGTGYPHGLADDEIPAIARIIRVADSFNAMTSTRFFRPGRPAADALDEIVALSGTHYDPDVVQAFMRLLQTPGVIRELSLASLQIDLGESDLELHTA